MINSVYALYNNLSNRYGDVLTFPNDAFALARLEEKIPPELRSEYQVCHIGNIDVENGILTPLPAPVRVAWRSVGKLPVTESVSVDNKDKQI